MGNVTVNLRKDGTGSLAVLNQGHIGDEEMGGGVADPLPETIPHDAPLTTIERDFELIEEGELEALR